MNAGGMLNTCKSDAKNLSHESFVIEVYGYRKVLKIYDLKSLMLSKKNRHPQILCEQEVWIKVIAFFFCICDRLDEIRKIILF